MITKAQEIQMLNSFCDSIPEKSYLAAICENLKSFGTYIIKADYIDNYLPTLQKMNAEKAVIRAEMDADLEKIREMRAERDCIRMEMNRLKTDLLTLQSATTDINSSARQAIKRLGSN